MSENAISVKDVSKVYKLYGSNKDRFVDAFGLSKQKRFKEHFALNHLSFDVKKGETIGIIGTNGAGKSTILKIITGVVGPTSGEVEIDGRISALLELGAGFNPEYTGVENVYLNGTMMGFTKEEVDAKLESILEFADIGEFAYQPVKSYSSGMFVRLAFAVAINIEPEILIVDEALSVGDVFFQAKCYRKFDEFKRMGKTILFVSHDLSSMSKYCDRVVLLDHGNKVDEGTPKDMINLYKKIMVNQYNTKAAEATKQGSVSDSNTKSNTNWKDFYTINPEVDEYGDGRAHIVDFALRDENDNITATIVKGSTFKIVSKVQFDQSIEDPIFTYSFKNSRGVTITGTNTLYENVEIKKVEAGDVYTCTFTQPMDLHGGEYLLSISCTGYSDGAFQVYHRLYDVVNITVISDKDAVGLYDMNSTVEVVKE